MAMTDQPSTSYSPTNETQTEYSESRKEVKYKIKEIKFAEISKHIVLQNENGPCPLIAISNILLLRNEMELDPDTSEIPQMRLLELVNDTLMFSNIHLYRDVVKRIPCLVYGINVNIKFKSINDFEHTPELDIFRLLDIRLYHGWIVDPQDFETANAIGSKSYNDLTTELVALETQSLKARSSQLSGESSLDLSMPMPSAYEENIVLLRTMNLSEREAYGFDVHEYAEDENQMFDIKSKSNLESTENDCISEIPLKSEDVTFANPVPDSSVRSQDDDDDDADDDDRGEKSISFGSPIYEGEELYGKSSSKESDTPQEGEVIRSFDSPIYEGEELLGKSSSEEGEVIRRFLNNNATQLTFQGIISLKEGLEESKPCVFFRNNHFSTMIKVKKELYMLVTDEGYLEKQDVVWERLDQVNGDSVYVNDKFEEVFKTESSESKNWNTLDAITDAAVPILLFKTRSGSSLKMASIQSYI